MNLKKDDFIVSAFLVTEPSFFILTQRGSLKRVSATEIPATSRANRGLQVLRELKNKPHRVFLAGNVIGKGLGQDIDLFSDIDEKTADSQLLEVMSKTGESKEINLAQLNLSERTSNGSFISETISDQEVLAARIH